MDIGVRGTPYFVLPLTRKHIDALMLLSGVHYDARCKDASKQGGFIYGWNNGLMFHEKYGTDGEVFTVNASSDDAQTVMKILESISICLTCNIIDEATAKLCRDLSRNLHGAYSLSNEKYREWRATYQGTT